MSPLPNGISPGLILRHSQFYKNPDREWEAKFLIILAVAPGGDIIFRLLTSQSNSRPEQPRCYHGDPYPSYFLGILGKQLQLNSWLDLRYADDYDEDCFIRDLEAGILAPTFEVPRDLFCDALTCVVGAEDTTRQQEKAIRELRAALNCE